MGMTRVNEMTKIQPDTTTDRATTAFIRRTLCAHNVLLGNGDKAGTSLRPIEEALPPLTSSNEVDLQLYGIISVIIKEFVQTWYSRITPDHVFVNEVIQIIAHCTRALEQRLRKVDLEALLLDEIPDILHGHIITFRQAKQQATSGASLVSDPRIIYHTIHPHPALSPIPNDLKPTSIIEQRESESEWRQLLVQGVLAVLLPTEDLENGCLRALIAEIFAEMILGNGISGKACEGWLLWESITRIAEVLQTDDTKEKEAQSDAREQEQPLTRLERYGLLSADGVDSSIPGRSESGIRQYHFREVPLLNSGVFWTIVQYALLAITAVRAVMVEIATSSSLPSRYVISEQSSDDGLDQSQTVKADVATSGRMLGKKRPIVSMKLWSCAAQVGELDLRMPWLLGFISMLHRGVLAGPGRVGDMDGILDRFLSHNVRTRILNPAFLPVILRTIRATIFPNNGLGPARDAPSSEEAQEMKARCAVALLGLIPRKMADSFFATTDSMVQQDQVEEVLSCLEDPYLNKHLIFQIVELIIVRLVPELGSRGVQELLEDRMV